MHRFKFPSLTGVIHFLILTDVVSFNHVATAQFPSLTGVIHFLILRKRYNINTLYKVSVPYRGYSFFNADIFVISIVIFNKVSVPYRGYSFFNVIINYPFYVADTWGWFPSLTGVIHFLILPSKTRMITWLKMRFAGQNYF